MAIHNSSADQAKLEEGAEFYLNKWTLESSRWSLESWFASYICLTTLGKACIISKLWFGRLKNEENRSTLKDGLRD